MCPPEADRHMTIPWKPDIGQPMCYYNHHCNAGNRCEFSICSGFYTIVASFISLDFLYFRLEMAPSKLAQRVQKCSLMLSAIK